MVFTVGVNSPCSPAAGLDSEGSATGVRLAGFGNWAGRTWAEYWTPMLVPDLDPRFWEFLDPELDGMLAP